MKILMTDVKSILEMLFKSVQKQAKELKITREEMKEQRAIWKLQVFQRSNRDTN